jgi:hypothetical protein
MERLNLTKLKDVEVNCIRLKSQICLQLWETLMIMIGYSMAWESIRENIRASAIDSLNNTSHGLKKSAQNYETKGRRLISTVAESK